MNNAGAVADSGEVVVIDTAATEARARSLRTTLATATGAPARTVVNTHFHGDHMFGNFVFRPEAAVVAHERARTEGAAAGLGMSGLWPDVEWGNIELVLPTITYQDRLTLHVNEQRMELYHPGPAHTLTDTVVWIPEHLVLFTGDIVMSGATPFCLMGSISGSLRAVRRLRELGARTVVAGHGPVGGPELFDNTESYLCWIQRIAADGYERGTPPLELAAEIDLGEFSELLDPERLVGNLHRAYAELRGDSEGSELDVLAVFREMMEYHGGPLPCMA
nr:MULTISPECIES: MBL fold metallo-hydrolase [unclassified Actinopolyspora]